MVRPPNSHNRAQELIEEVGIQSIANNNEENFALPIPNIAVEPEFVAQQNSSIVATQTTDEENRFQGNEEPLIDEESANEEFDAPIDPLSLIKHEALEPIHDEDIDDVANIIISNENIFVAGNDMHDNGDESTNSAVGDGNNAETINNLVRDDENGNQSANSYAGNENGNGSSNIVADDGNVAETIDNLARDYVEYERWDDDVFISVGDMPLPYIPNLQLKTNDEFSGSLPFVEFVSILIYLFQFVSLI